MLGVAQAAGKMAPEPKTSPPALSNVPAAGPASGAGKAATTADAATPRKAGPARASNSALPAPVAEMREAILAAVQSGAIGELAVPLAWNEMKPDIADKAGDDPIAFLKAKSGDGQGRELLAVLGRILELRPARVTTGADVENNAVYVWPYLAEADLAALGPGEEVELYRLVSPADAKLMRDKKKWTWWRLSIGADGTWHTFQKTE